MKPNDNKLTNQNHSDFSIDHILNRAGTSNHSRVIESNSLEFLNSNLNLSNYSWLQCSRYCPPKIPRSQRRDGPQKRQLGRHPRIPFTSQQLAILEEKFQKCPYLSSEEVIKLSNQLNLADIRVKIWFQNRRARERREKAGQMNNNEQEMSGQNSDDSSRSPITNEDSGSLVQPSTSSTRNSLTLLEFLPPERMFKESLPHYIQNNSNLPSSDSG